MDEPSLFLRIRTVAFCCVNLVSFLWIILYSIVLFSQWDSMARSEKTLISVMLVTNVITLITLLILLLLEFRVWLDTARISFLLIANIGTAIAFVHWRLQFQCEEKIGDQQGVCDMISVCILVISWVVPLLLIAYLAGLAFKEHRYRTRKSADCPLFDTEDIPTSPSVMASGRPSLLPIMTAFPTPASLNFPSEAHHNSRRSMNARRSAMSTWSRGSSPPATPNININPGRLSKRSPLANIA